MSVRFTAGSGTGLETSGATVSPGFPVSISVWFRIARECVSDSGTSLPLRLLSTSVEA